MNIPTNLFYQNHTVCEG